MESTQQALQESRPCTIYNSYNCRHRQQHLLADFAVRRRASTESE